MVQRLGQILLKARVLSQDVLRDALLRAKEKREKLGETLVAMKRYHAAWDSGKVDVAVEGGGESPASAFERAWAGVGPVLARHAAAAPGGETVALVAHGRIFKILLSTLVAGDLAKMDAFPQGNTAVTILEHDAAPGARLDRGWRVVLLNDQSHLGPQPPQIPGDALV